MQKKDLMVALMVATMTTWLLDCSSFLVTDSKVTPFFWTSLCTKAYHYPRSTEDTEERLASGPWEKEQRTPGWWDSKRYPVKIADTRMPDGLSWRDPHTPCLEMGIPKVCLLFLLSFPWNLEFDSSGGDSPPLTRNTAQVVPSPLHSLKVQTLPTQVLNSHLSLDCGQSSVWEELPGNTALPEPWVQRLSHTSSNINSRSTTCVWGKLTGQATIAHHLLTGLPASTLASPVQFPHRSLSDLSNKLIRWPSLLLKSTLVSHCSQKWPLGTAGEPLSDLRALPVSGLISQSSSWLRSPHTLTHVNPHFKVSRSAVLTI